MTEDSIRLLTREDVGEWLQIHPRTVMRLVKDGKLKAVRVGGRTVRFRRSDVEAYIEQGAA